MTAHPALRAQLLDNELAVARARLGERVTGGAGLHPVLNRPFACIRGCAEYYCHPSHLQERWDTLRNTLRLADLLDHALRRAGRP